MGWPKKDELLRLYQDKRDKAYVMVDTETYEGVANVMLEPEPPSLGSTSFRKGDLTDPHGDYRRVQWKDLPEHWQKAFKDWLPDDLEPEDVPGFWLISHRPQKGAERGRRE